MNSDQETFLQAILTQPDDDTVRLVYADWLTENGDPDRGEFIRVQIELTHVEPNSDAEERRRSYLFGRQAELLKLHKKEWLAPFTPYAKETSFARGFVQSLEVSANVFIRNAEKWFDRTPLTRVKITTCFEWNHGHGARTWWGGDLFSSPYLSRLTSLDLELLQITPTTLEPFAEHPNLSRLRELVLTSNPIGNDGARLLAAMPQLSNLESLDLRSVSITDVGARAIADSVHLQKLKEIRLSRNSIREPTWELLEERFAGALMG